MYFFSINGEQIDSISINDRGLAYGDGIFTTAKIHNGQVLLLNKHIQRLEQGCDFLKIAHVDFSKLLNDLVITAQDYSLAVLKVIITAGEGGRGYSRKNVTSPNIIIKVSEFPTHYKKWEHAGITLSDAHIKLGLNPLFLGIKHLNRIEQVLLRDELEQTTHNDLLVSNINDNIIETTCGNIFWFYKNELYTPEIVDSGIAGIMRAEIIRKHSTVKIIKASRQDILNAQSIFITNSIMEIIPVLEYAGKRFNLNKVHQFIQHIANIN